MTKKMPVDDNDAHLFRDAMKRIKPLKQPNRILHEQTPRQPPKLTDATFKAESKALEEVSIPDVTGDEPLTFYHSGIQPNYLRKLKRGKIAVSESIDLHRMTVIEAEHAIVNFITFAKNAGIRCIRIVHGKGHMAKTEKPILKNKVNRWLRAHASVLAFCSALPNDGGTGAVYVLLKQGGYNYNDPPSVK